jgi:uncharacterized protein
MIQRIPWLLAGWISLGIGAVGAILPLVPTVPFLLLAALAFSRSSPQMHHWLSSESIFAPHIEAWTRNGSICRRAKGMAIAAIALSLLLSHLLSVSMIVLGVQALVLGGITVFLLTRPHGH